MSGDDESMTLLAKAASMALGRSFDTAGASGQEELRKFARDLAECPDSPETERVLDAMVSLAKTSEPKIKVTMGVAPLIIQLDIPEEKRVLKRGRYYNTNRPDLTLGH